MKNKPFEEINALFDFYGSLLTTKQQEIIRYYYDEDYSLAEISELLNVSRSAVLDNIKRSEKALRGYEDKLHLYAKFLKKEAIYDQMIDDNLEKYVKILRECD